ncbi:hypothetical protein IT570_12655 [Candidatus Sumerlaeota bacterium]|nr:hypothetical protein [Candidatus Sumerlaeota bacterium]
MKRSLIFSLLTSAALLAPLSSEAVTITIQYNDGPSEGFNDATLGPARKAAFEYAAAVWANRLSGTINIVIAAEMNPLGGGPTSALLGFAGPDSAHANFTGVPISNVWYPTPLANQLGSTPTDRNGGTEEIAAQFNSDVDNPVVLGSTDWYYGLDENAGTDISFVRTCLHEFGHGLGFVGFLTTDGNGDNPDGTYNTLPGVFDLFIENNGGTDLSGMATATRLAALTSDDLYWNGASVTGSIGSRARMYAPAVWEPGSSYSHFREATPVLGVEELMEPILNGDSIVMTHTDNAFADIGWSILGPTALPQMDFDSGNPVAIAEGSGAQTFTVTLTSTNSQPVTATLQLNPNGTDTATPGVDYTVSSTTVSIPSGTSTTFTVTAPIDGNESDETFTMRLTRMVGAEFATAPTVQRTITINNMSSVNDWQVLE